MTYNTENSDTITPSYVYHISTCVCTLADCAYLGRSLLSMPMAAFGLRDMGGMGDMVFAIELLT